MHRKQNIEANLIVRVWAVVLACVLFGLTPAEALAGATRNAARALGMESEIGTLAVGKRADFVVWNVEHPAQLAAQFGPNPCYRVVVRGDTLI